jgi:ABC-type glycerol-3-phosphate transport system substrate-binding protein
VKKYLSAVWVMLLLCVPGCKKDDAAVQNRVVIWASYTNEEMVVFREIVAGYQKTLPAGSPEFVVEQVPFSGLLSKIITAAIARKTPDICRVDVGHVARLAYGGIAEPLDSYQVERFHER